jgi:hypothetical protein
MSCGEHTHWAARWQGLRPSWAPFGALPAFLNGEMTKRLCSVFFAGALFALPSHAQASPIAYRCLGISILDYGSGGGYRYENRQAMSNYVSKAEVLFAFRDRRPFLFARFDGMDREGQVFVAEAGPAWARMRSCSDFLKLQRQKAEVHVDKSLRQAAFPVVKSGSVVFSIADHNVDASTLAEVDLIFALERLSTGPESLNVTMNLNYSNYPVTLKKQYKLDCHRDPTVLREL